MRQTLSDLISMVQDSVGGDSTTASQTFIKQRLNKNAEFVLSKMPTHLSQIERTFSTVASQQPYHYPPGIRSVESLMLTIGSRDYPLTPVFSFLEWRKLNAIDIDAGAFPEKYLNQQRDFEIWPIPQAVYTGTIVYNIRASGMTRTDYTTGTCTVTENDATVEGAGGVAWSTVANVVPDMWFSLADSNGESRGNWYRIASITDADTLELESVFEETGIAGSNYIIGESPELPEDVHEIIAQLTTADFYAERRQALSKAQAWQNRAWTGDFNNSSRDPRQVAGGLINAIRMYQDRSEDQLVRRRTTRQDIFSKIRASSISM